MQALFKAVKVILQYFSRKIWFVRPSQDCSPVTTTLQACTTPASQQYKPKGLVGLNTSDVTLSPKPTSFSAETLK